MCWANRSASIPFVGKVDALLDRHELSPTMLGLLPLSAAW